MRPADYRTRPICNLAPNPSFEASSGTVEVRRNHATKPVPTDASTGWGSNAPALYVPSFDATGGRRAGTGARKFVRAPATPDTAIASAYAAGIPGWGVGGRVPVTPGEVWTASVYVKVSVAFIARVTVAFYDAANVAVGSSVVGADAPGAAGEWVRPFVTVTIPAGATNFGIIVAGASLPSGFTVGGEEAWMADAMYEKSPVLLPYFDGSYSPDPDLTPAWVGTPNASASVLNGVAVVGQSAGGAASQVRISSTQWSKSGTRSFRNIPLVTANDSHIFGIDGDAGGMRLGMVAGRTYTALVTMRLSQPLTGSLHHRSRTITLLSRVGAGPYVYSSSAQAPNVAGEHQLRHTFTVPSDATEAFVRLYNGASAGNGDVWWDDFMIVEGVYNGPYRDGDSPGWAWLGAPGQSQSAGPGGL